MDNFYVILTYTMIDKTFGIGSKVGKLTLVSLDSHRRVHGEIRHFYKCKCDCGGIVVAQRNVLKRKSRQSCGCLVSSSHKIHGERNTRLYGIWVGMRNRCRNKHKYWGGRGITVCKEWDSNYVAFREWAKNNGYSDSLSIDRINNDGNYSPENCRFVTNAVQNRNTRNNKFVTAFGETKCLKDWFSDRRVQINDSNYRKRLRRGMTTEVALFSPRKYALLA